MKQQGSGERTETDDSETEMNGTARLIAESDIDSQSDFEIVSAESSDVELLVRVPQHNKRRRWITKVKNAPSKAAERAKEGVRHYRQQCTSCVMWCTQCKCECSVEMTKSYAVEKSKAGVAKLKMMLSLLQDRRVLLSTGIYGLLGFITIISIEVCQMLHCDRYTWQDIHRLGGGWRESYNDWLAWLWTTVCSAEHSSELYLQQVQHTTPYFV